MVATPGICQRPDCGAAKAPGRGVKLCPEHQATALSENIERKKDRQRLPCQFPGCTDMKLKGAGQRYCEVHSSESYARQTHQQNQHNRKMRSGLSDEQYQAMVTAQNGLCALCGGPPGQRQLHVDHDHACCPGRDSCGKCLRGLLCGRCNPLLGYAHDDIAILHAAITYLEKYRRTEDQP